MNSPLILCTTTSQLLWTSNHLYLNIVLNNEAFVYSFPEFSIRLVDGSHQREGRVEVSIGSKWGSICATQLDMKVGHVICRKLGLTNAISVLPATTFTPRPSDGDLPVHLCNLSCNGTEDNIERCSFIKVPATYSHDNDIGVRCSDRGAPKG